MFQNLNFKPGRALRNTELWRQDINLLKRHSYPVPDFAEHMILKGLVSIKHKRIYNEAKRRVDFNNESFDTMDRLEQKYKKKQDPNYEGARNQEEILTKIVKEYEENEILREPKSWELEKVTINPVNTRLKIMQNESEILSWKINMYILSWKINYKFCPGKLR